jgi:hypothetical protein
MAAAAAGLGPAAVVLAYYLGTGGPIQPGILSFIVSPVVAGLLIGGPLEGTKRATVLAAAGYLIAAYLVHMVFGILAISLREGRDLAGLLRALLEAMGTGAFITAIYFPFWAVVLSPLALGWAAAARVIQHAGRTSDTKGHPDPRALRPRHSSTMLLASAAAVLGYTLGFMVVAPSQCIATSTVGAEASVTGASTTVCTSLIGMTYSGQGTFDPPRDLAIQVGLVVAAVAFLLARRVSRRSRLDTLAGRVR